MPQAVPYVAAALLAVGVPAGATTFLANVIVLAGTVAVGKLLTPNAPRNNQQQAPLMTTARYEAAPRRYAVGRRMMGSVEVFADAKQEPLAWHRAVLVHCDGLIDGFEQTWLDDAEVVIDIYGTVVSPIARWKLTLGSAFASVESYTGTTTQTSNYALGFDFPTTWGSDHRLLGVAYSVRSCKAIAANLFSGAYRSNRPPAVRRVLRGLGTPDPSDESCNLDDPSTWTWNPNAGRVILGLLLRDNWKWNGFGLASTRFALDEWIAFIAACAVSRTTISDLTEQTFEIHDEWNASERPVDILRRYEEACAAEIYVRDDGLVGVRGARWQAPTRTFTAKNCIVETRLEKGPDIFGTANTIDFQFCSPDHQYAMQPGRSLRDAVRIAAAGGRVVSMPIASQCVVSHRQMTHLAAIRHARNWAGWRGTIITDARGQIAWNDLNINLVDPDYEINDPTPFRILDRKESEDGRTLEWTVEQASESVWAHPALTEPPRLPPPSDPAQRIRPPGAISASYTDGTTGNKIVTFTVEPPTRGDCGVEIFWWVSGAASTSTYLTAGGQYCSLTGTYQTILLQPDVVSAVTGDIPTGSEIVFMAGTITPNGYRSEHTTAWVEASTDAYPFGSHTFPSITLT